MTHTEEVPYDGYVYIVEFSLELGRMPEDTEIEIFHITPTDHESPRVRREEMERHLYEIWDEIIPPREKRFDI